MKLIESTSLAFNDIDRGGTSDKVYHLALEQNGAGYLVSAQYGRRGSTLATDNKTKAGAVPYAEARRIYDKVLREKQAKGYRLTGHPERTRGTSQASATNAVAAPLSQASATIVATAQAIHAQELLDEIPSEEAMLAYLNDDRYWMQDKSDGHSRGAVKTASGAIFGLNKTGQSAGLPAAVVEELEAIPLDTFQLDAELVGEQLICRDILDADGDVSRLSYADRFGLLVSVINPREGRLVSVVPTWEGARNKAAALIEQRAQRREGVVFKLKAAHHRGGRSGQHRKFKFVKTLSAIAGKPRARGKDSVELFLHDNSQRGSRLVRCGTVSLIGKPPVREGDVVEVRYLYAYPSKLIVQARLLRVRDDVRPNECTTAQLIYKAD